MLGRREHSVAELRKKLQQKHRDLDQQALKRLLEMLQEDSDYGQCMRLAYRLLPLWKTNNSSSEFRRNSFLGPFHLDVVSAEKRVVELNANLKTPLVRPLSHHR